jgi:Fe-S-cluster containining protein
MLQGMTKEQIETLKERAAQWLKQALPFLSVPLVSSFRYLKADIKCPFLKGNLCSVYERRPMSCRTHFAIGNPEHCKLPHRPNQLILQFQFTAGGWPALWIKWFTSHITQLDHIGLHLHNLLFGTEIKSSQYQIWPPS